MSSKLAGRVWGNAPDEQMSNGSRRVHQQSTSKRKNSLPVSVDVVVMNIGNTRVRVGDGRVLMRMRVQLFRLARPRR